MHCPSVERSVLGSSILTPWRDSPLGYKGSKNATSAYLPTGRVPRFFEAEQRCGLRAQQAQPRPDGIFHSAWSQRTQAEARFQPGDAFGVEFDSFPFMLASARDRSRCIDDSVEDAFDHCIVIGRWSAVGGFISHVGVVKADVFIGEQEVGRGTSQVTRSPLRRAWRTAARAAGSRCAPRANADAHRESATRTNVVLDKTRLGFDGIPRNPNLNETGPRSMLAPWVMRIS